MCTSKEPLALAYKHRHRRLATPTSIRLLQLSLDGATDTICCQISQHEQEFAPAYIAMSYLWGAPWLTRFIEIGGEDPSILPRQAIHENAWQMLRNLAIEQRNVLPDGPAYFWTDCLSLDQECNEELNEQIPRMGVVYSSAEKVIAWIGTDGYALDAIMHWGRLVDGERIFVHDKSSWEEGNEATWEDLYNIIYHVVTLDYWRRAWIVQEIVLAREALVMAGDVVVRLESLWDKIQSGVGILHGNGYGFIPGVTILPDEDPGDFGALVSWRRSGSEMKPLWYLARSCAQKQCTARMDKIYSFLGLVAMHEDGTHPAALIEVNREKLPWEVFWDINFECRAPFDKLLGVIDSLVRGLIDLNDGFRLDMRDYLERYVCASRTSDVHAGYARCALEVYQAAVQVQSFTGNAILTWLFEINTGSIQEFLLAENYPLSRMQEAAMIGLVLGLELGHARFDVSKVAVTAGTGPVLWKCALHHTEPQEPACGGNPRAFSFSYSSMSRYDPDRSIAQQENFCAFLDDGSSCDTSTMTCMFDNASLRMDLSIPQASGMPVLCLRFNDHGDP